MEQIVDLQNDQQFQDLGIDLVSLAIDPVSDLTSAADEYGIDTPFVSDEDSQVSESYGVLRWAMASGEPGHTFVLVDGEGIVRWIRDYGAPENGGLMYVATEKLYQELAQLI